MTEDLNGEFETRHLKRSPSPAHVVPRFRAIYDALYDDFANFKMPSRLACEPEAILRALANEIEIQFMHASHQAADQPDAFGQASLGFDQHIFLLIYPDASGCPVEKAVSQSPCG